MVAARKLNYFSKRLDEIETRKRQEIEKKHPIIATSIGGLIAEGKGKMLSEAEIRELCRISQYTCPPVIELARLFDLKDEKEKAKKIDEKRHKAVEADKEKLSSKIKAARDLVFFGTDEDLRKALDDLEKF